MPDQSVSDAARREADRSVFAEMRTRVSVAYKADAGQRIYPELTATTDFSTLPDSIMDPFGQKTHLTAFSCGLLMIITQEPAQSLAALDAPLSIEVTVPRK